LLSSIYVVQGQSLEAVKRLLKSRAMAHAVHQLLAPYTKALPPLAISIQQLAARLHGAAEKLHFVSTCHTKICIKSTKSGCLTALENTSVAQVRMRARRSSTAQGYREWAVVDPCNADRVRTRGHEHSSAKF
jgi:hypothetical protein